MSNINLAGTYGLANALIPRGGPKAVKATLDFSNTAEIVISGQQIVSQEHIEFLQGLYIDNSNNDFPLTLVMSTTGQKLIAPARTQGYYTILVPNEPQITATMNQGAGRVVPVLFYNVPIQAQLWSVV